MGIFITRYIIETTVVVLSIVHLFNYTFNEQQQEREPLLAGSNNGQHYGSSSNSRDIVTKEPGPFHDFFGKMKKLLPYIWPHHDTKLQIYVVIYFLLMCCGFAVNLLAPRQIGIIVDNLKKGAFAWAPILAYIGLKFLQGGVNYIIYLF